MAGGVRVLHLEVVDDVRQHRPEKHQELGSRFVTCVFLNRTHENESAGVLPGQQEGRSHSDPGGEGDNVGEKQVTLQTHHQDHEGNHRLERTEYIRPLKHTTSDLLPKTSL